MNDIEKEFFDYVNHRSNKRELVMLGVSDKIYSIISNNNKKSAKIFSTNTDLIDNKKVYNSINLKGMSNEYYVVIARVLNDGGRAIKRHLENMGFKSGDDFAFYPYISFNLSEGRDTNSSECGNKFKCHSNKNTDVVIEGTNNEINIEEFDSVGTGSLKIKIMGSRNRIIIKKGFRLTNTSDIIINGSDSELVIDENCKVAKIKIDIHNNSSIFIGANTTIGSGSSFNTHANGEIIIGTDCMFSWNTKLQTGDGHSLFDCKTKKRINNYEKSRLELSDHIWIARDAMIFSGKKTFIGRGSVIGANSCVKGIFRDNNVVIAGNPARIRKRNIAWARHPNADNIEQCNGYAEESRYI